MTANHAHTPTTEQVRLNYAYLGGLVNEPEYDRRTEAFDRWLAERDARIEAATEQRGAIKALRDAAHSPRLRDAVHYAIKHEKYADAARRSFENYLLQEANRADQIADQEDLDALAKARTEDDGTRITLDEYLEGDNA